MESSSASEHSPRVSSDSTNDAAIFRVVDPVLEYSGLLLHIEQLAAVPAQIIEFPAVRADHDDRRFADVAVILREYIAAEVVFRIRELARRVTLSLQQRCETAAGAFARRLKTA